MMNDADVVNLVKRLVREAKDYNDELSKDRSDATDYYNGKMPDLPAKAGKSAMGDKVVRSSIKKVMPSVIRTILGNPKVFEFQPMSQEDEEGAEQAGQYINHVVMPESDGYKAIHDGIHDALLLRSGIIKGQWKVNKKVSVASHTGLTIEELAPLVNDPDVEILEQDETIEEIETPDGEMQEIPLYSVKIKRVESDEAVSVDAVPLEQFLIHPDAKTLEESPLVGQWQKLRRSDLIAMGYDKEKVLGLPTNKESDDELEQTRDERTDADRAGNGEDYSNKALQEIDYYELYVQLDRDDDGLSEMLKICFGGGLGQDNLLEIEDWDKQPFVDLAAEEQPHQWQGASIADDTMDLQKVKTALLRETLDNTYATNKPQPIIQDGKVENEDAIFNPAFGKPIRIAAGTSVKDALGYTNTPFVADKSFAMLDYFDNVVQDRTGISEASSGMAPDALQNMTAKASSMIEAAGIGQTEMMVRSLARGIKKLGSLLLHLVVQHQDKPRTIRLRNEWVKYDPRSWNSGMDVTVNTGLGAGTRERDMQMLMYVKQIQTELLTALGPDNPFVKPDNLYNMLEKMTEAAGFASAEPYFTEPDPEEIKAKLEQQKNQPNPEKIKADAQMQIEQMKAQVAVQIEQEKAKLGLQAKEFEVQANRDKERAQMEADLTVRNAELEKEQIARAEELQSNSVLEGQKIELERERMAQEREFRLLDIDLRREEMHQKHEADIQKHQASAFSQQLNNQMGASQ